MPFAGIVGFFTGAGRERLAPVCIVALAVWAWSGVAGAAQAALPCSADHIDDLARVSLVQDGDTLRLNDGRRVRLIGINTPELARDGRAAEPGAIAARDRLRQILFGNHQQVQLRFDRERHDRYGRLLAHAFLKDGRNLTEMLLAAGLGTQFVVPPNTWQADCYNEASRHARDLQQGVWALPGYRPRPVEALDRRASGFHIVLGRVTHISRSASAVWINLAGNFALRIERGDLVEFQDFAFEKAVGNEVEVQGWIYSRNGQLRMPLRHPSAIRILGPAPSARDSLR